MYPIVTEESASKVRRAYSGGLKKNRILLIEDEAVTRGLLAGALREAKFDVVEAGSAREARACIATRRFDLISLDLGLPDERGIILAAHIVEQLDIPIIMVTAFASAQDMIAGLDIGADDYIQKPMDTAVYVARVRAVLRRYERDINTDPAACRHSIGTYHFAGWSLDLKNRDLKNGSNALVSLTSAEFDLLCVFVRNPNAVLSRAEIMGLLRGENGRPPERTVDLQVSRLRRKIETDHAAPRLIKTIRRHGYQFCADVVPA